MGDLECVNILLVDDRPDGLLALEAVLRHPEYRLMKIQSGEEALRWLLEHDEDIVCILMDVQMPRLDGFETAGLIKSQEKYRHIPIIFVTGIHSDPRFVSQGYELGAIDYVTKPFQPNILRSKVAVLVELYRKTKLLREMQARDHEMRLTQQRQALEEHFFARERRLIALVENSPDFIAMADPRLNVTYINAAGRALVGIPSESDACAKTIPDFFTPAHRTKVLDEILPRLERDGEWEDELAFQHFTSNAEIPVWSRAFALRDPSTGQIESIATVTRDVSRQKATERYLRDTADLLTRSNAELQRFAWVASHDLKEPLRMVSSYMRLLERRYKGKLDAEADKYIQYAVDGACRMYSLVDGILAFSGIDRCAQPLRTVDCNQIFDSAVSSLHVTIRENGARVTRGTLPRVMADPAQLGQLFQNLIANAIKFRREPPPTIHVDAERDGDQWRFGFQDNGIGIEDQFFEKIFFVFERLHTKDQYPGSGVGLAICKKIVEKHGGKIWVHSRPGTGSTFYFSFPSLLRSETLYGDPLAGGDLLRPSEKPRVLETPL